MKKYLKTYDLICGKYYKNDRIDDVWYFLFDKKDDTYIYTSGYVIYNKIYYVANKLHFDINNSYNEVDFLDILDYLPVNNPERIVYLRNKRINHLLNL